MVDRIDELVVHRDGASARVDVQCRTAYHCETVRRHTRSDELVETGQGETGQEEQGHTQDRRDRGGRNHRKESSEGKGSNPLRCGQINKSKVVRRTIPETSSGLMTFSPFSPVKTLTLAFPSLSSNRSKGKCFLSAWTDASLYLRPMRRLASKTVLRGLEGPAFLAASPMRREPSGEKPT